MNKSYLVALLSLFIVFGLGTTARAQEEQVVTKVPFDFVVNGQAMPAGTYNVSRIDGPQRGLVIKGSDSSTFFLPIVFERVDSDQASLGFKHIGTSYYLSTVKTLDNVYTLGTPRPMTKVAQMKDNTSSSSSSGSN